MADESSDTIIDPKENGVNERHSQTYTNDPDRMRTEGDKDPEHL